MDNKSQWQDNGCISFENKNMTIKEIRIFSIPLFCKNGLAFIHVARGYCIGICSLLFVSINNVVLLHNDSIKVSIGSHSWLIEQGIFMPYAFLFMCKLYFFSLY